MTKREFLLSNIKIIDYLYKGRFIIYGPYIRKQDNRCMFQIIDGHRKYYFQYARIKMEIFLRRRLSYNETVDHDDGNKRNDRYSNLIIRDRSVHASLDVIRKNYGTVNCAWCGNKVRLSRNQVNSRSKKKAGPFCSKQCTGKYGKYIQNKGSKLKRIKIPKPILYTLKD